MAQTTNKIIQFRNLGATAYDYLPLSGSVIAYQGAIAGITSDNYIKHASNASTVRGAGIIATFGDNSDGVSGDLSVNVYTSGEFALTVTGTVAYGDPVYANSDEVVAASGSLATEGVYVGRALEAHETLSGVRWIRLDGPKKSGYPTV